MDWYLAIDIGTGGIHVAAVDDNLSVLGIKYEKLEYTNLPAIKGKEINLDALFNSILALCSELITEKKTQPGECKGIVITGQRHGAVFLDAKGKVLLACPNIDGRAEGIAASTGKENGQKTYAITSRWPAPYFPAIRSLWLRAHRPDAHARFRHLLMLNEWLGWKLTTVMASEPTNAAETLAFDIGKRQWSEELKELFALGKVELNPLVPSGSAIGQLSARYAKLFGLPAATPVILAPSDTQSAAIGCGALALGDIVVVNGSTTPIVQVVDRFISDGSKKMWITPYVDDTWLIEANANKSGIMYRFLTASCTSFIRNIVQSMGLEMDEVALNKAIQLMDSHNTKAIGYWSPRVSDVSNPQIDGYALFAPFEENPYAAVLSTYAENLAFAVQGNIELVISLSGIGAVKIWLTGGGCENKKFCSLVATLSSQANVLKTRILETTMRGAVAAAIGKTRVRIAAITEKFREEADIVEVLEDKAHSAQRYKLWREGYDGVFEFHHRRNCEEKSMHTR